MSDRSKLNWKMLSEYRLQIFGFSIISVMVFHFFMDMYRHYSDGIFRDLSKGYIFLIGSIGVEIFLFLSGMGLYFSMSRNNNIGQFYRKRFQRVLIPYLIWGLIFWLWSDIFIAHKSVRRFLIDYTTISTWTQGKRVMWYVNFILVMYLLFPILFQFLRKEKPHRGIRTAILVCVSFGLTIAMKFIFKDIYKNIEIELYRIPIFIIGVYYGKAIAEERKLSKIDISLIVFGILLKIGYALGKLGIVPYLNKIPARMVQCFYCLIIMFIFAVIAKICINTKINTVLTFCGKYSFELYITHMAIRSIMNRYGISTYKIQNYLICIIASVLCSIALSKATNLILKTAKKA